MNKILILRAIFDVVFKSLHLDREISNEELHAPLVAAIWRQIEEKRGRAEPETNPEPCPSDEA